MKPLEIEFKSGGWSKKELNCFEGTYPVRRGSNKNWKIWGKWNEGCYAFNEETKMLIW